MLQTSENYSNIREPTKKTQKIFHNTKWKTEYAIYGVYNLQPTVCR